MNLIGTGSFICRQKTWNNQSARSVVWPLSGVFGENVSSFDGQWFAGRLWLTYLIDPRWIKNKPGEGRAQEDKI